ncbi:MAG TPA: tetratricopeptide repeat protein, partial [Elusimicrobiota bacterium]|nr:tetratricopeptide repeat protein [Elusimicrobiota bacterium]
NRDVLGDPRVRAHAADGRRFLSSSSASYDLVSSEPSNPWIAGVSSLYTREAFEAVRARLEPGGVFLQWFHSYHMSARDFRMILRTFVSVFPHSLLFWNGESDFFLVGSPTPWSIDYPRIQRIMGEARVKEDLAAAKPSFQRPLSLLVSTFLLGEEDLRAASAGAEIQADDLPALEFRAPHSHGRGEGHAILEALLAAKTHPLPPLRNFSPGPRDAAAMRALSGELFLSSGERAKARAAFESALALYPADAVALVGLGRVLEESGERGRAESLYRRARAAEPGRPDGHLQLGLLLVRSGRKAEGIACLERGLALGPPEPAASLELAMQYLEAGRKEDARKVLARALERPVADDLVNENLGLALKIARS